MMISDEIIAHGIEKAKYFSQHDKTVFVDAAAAIHRGKTFDEVIINAEEFVAFLHALRSEGFVLGNHGTQRAAFIVKKPWRVEQ